MNGGMNVCVNDMRANERTCERMYVRVSVRASDSVSVRPCVCTVTRHARARTFENKVDLSRPYFCTTLPFFTFLVLWRFARTEIRSIRVDLISVRARARPVNVQTHTRTRTRPSTCTQTSVHSFAHTCTRPFTRSPYVRHHVR